MHQKRSEHETVQSPLKKDGTVRLVYEKGS